MECQICESKQNLTDIQTPRFKHLIAKVEIITDSQVEHRNWLRFVCLLCTAKLDHLWKFQNLCKNAYRKFLETLDTDPTFEIIEKCENDDIKLSCYSEALDMEEEEEKKYFPAQETVFLWEGNPTEVGVEPEFCPIKLPLLKEEKMKICDEEGKNIRNIPLPGIDANVVNASFKTEVAPVEISLKRSDSPNSVEDFRAKIGMETISLQPPGKENTKKLQRKTKSIESKTNKCSACNKEFKQRQSLRTHMKEVHEKTLRFVCDICGKGFTRNEPYKNHLEIHSEKRSHFSCAICSKIFTQKKNLLRHIIGIHIDRSKRQIAKSFCRHCKSRFNTREEYLEHVKTHPFVRIGTTKLERQKLKSRKNCSFCAKVFETIEALEAHEGIHSGEKPFACKICSKSFRKDQHLKIHMNVHTRVKKDPRCKYCCITFTSRKDYYRHLESHLKARLEAVKELECQYCRKEFQTNQQREKHERIHTGEKPFKCEICSKEFRQDPHLRTHMNIHTGEKKYPCDFCDKVFTLAGNLRVHRRIHTGEKPYECLNCSEKFHEQKMWKKHSVKCSEES